jgi:monovalent cation:H+ antiporter, CPA1 family
MTAVPVRIMVGRAIVVYLLLGGTSRIISDRYHPAVPIAWLHVMFWAGLRGAVAVAMAISLPAEFPQRTLLQEITFGVVLFTLPGAGHHHRFRHATDGHGRAGGCLEPLIWPPCT